MLPDCVLHFTCNTDAQERQWKLCLRLRGRFVQISNSAQQHSFQVPKIGIKWGGKGVNGPPQCSTDKCKVRQIITYSSWLKLWYGSQIEFVISCTATALSGGPNDLNSNFLKESKQLEGWGKMSPPTNNTFPLQTWNKLSNKRAF